MEKQLNMQLEFKLLKLLLNQFTIYENVMYSNKFENNIKNNQ